MCIVTEERLTQPKILLLGKIEEAHERFQRLEQAGSVMQIEETTRDEFLRCCYGDAFANVTIIIRTYDSTQMTGRVDEDLVSALPTSVRFICHVGAGYDSIDAIACAQRGIAVSNTPGVTDLSTATLAVLMIVSCLRNLPSFQANLRQNLWRGSMRFGRDPKGLVLGILGMGGIGAEVAKQATGHGMNILYHNRSRLPEENTVVDAKYVDFDELLAKSDVLSIHVPLNDSTRGLIGGEAIQKMKRGATIVNTARGQIVDECAVAIALKSGHLSSAGFDVYTDEPCIHSDLMESPQCMLTPHVGTATRNTQEAMENVALDNAQKALQEGQLVNFVPESAQLYTKGATVLTSGSV